MYNRIIKSLAIQFIGEKTNGKNYFTFQRESETILNHYRNIFFTFAYKIPINTNSFLSNTRQVVAHRMDIGETRIGIKFEVDTTGGGIPTTPPVAPENPLTDNKAQGQGDFPTTDKKLNGLVMLG